MKTTILAATLAGLLATAGATAVLSGLAPASFLPFAAPSAGSGATLAGADISHVHSGTSGDASQPGMTRLQFPLSSGTTPTAEDAKRLTSVGNIFIGGDADLTPASGVRSGTGTLADPYVLSGYYVRGILEIADTDACILLVGNYIDGTLRLNWNGNCVHVHHNFVRDLRVNENVARTGYDTGGLIEDNVVNYVGQIRHYDGEFRNNVVGPREDSRLPNGIFDDPENRIPFARDTRVLNVDGFNQGWFHHNTVTGSVDLKLHGHHHSTGFLADHSHYHGDNETRMAAMAHDHSDRWESVRFEDNVVNDPTGYGLRYTDEAHAGDDRRAPSETTATLDKPHTHHTKVEIRRNHVAGAGIWVDVFNADDRNHVTANPGWFWITDNRVELAQRHDDTLGFQFFGRAFSSDTAIRVDTMKEAQFDIRGNTLSWKATPNPDPLAAITGMFAADPTPIGIELFGIRNATVLVQDNQGTGFARGVAGARMDEAASWMLHGNIFPGAANEVYYDRSVANKPVDMAMPPLADPGAWGGATPVAHGHHG